MVLSEQFFGNFLVFVVIGWLATRALKRDESLTQVILVAAILAFLGPVFSSAASAEPWTILAAVLFAVIASQYALKIGWIETISLLVILWVFGVTVLGTTSI